MQELGEKGFGVQSDPLPDGSSVFLLGKQNFI